MLPTQNGILLIEPRRAHARILYERYLTLLKQTQRVSQQLLFPEDYIIQTEDKLYFEKILEDLHCLGFEIEHLGDNAFRINGIPADLQNSMPQDVLDEIVYAVKNSPTNIKDSYQEITAKTLANAAAMKMKRGLTTEEIQDLLNNLLNCKNHIYDASGKQIMIFIDKKEFENRF
jgi:DNA mismatch repair protein MutL